MLEKFKFWYQSIVSSDSSAANVWPDLQDGYCPRNDPRELPRPKKQQLKYRDKNQKVNVNGDKFHDVQSTKADTSHKCCKPETLQYIKQDTEHECHNCAKLDIYAECNICLESLQGSGIFSCIVCGHSMCLSCSSKVENCPFCRIVIAPVARFRNIALERFMSELYLPCKHFRWGCTKRLQVSERREHEDHCKFTPISCPFYPCIWQGIGETDFELHMETKHFKVLVGDRIIIDIPKFRSKMKFSERKERKYITSLFCYNNIFRVKIVLFKENLQLTLIRVCCGESHSRHFSARLDIRSSFRTMKSVIPIKSYGAKELNVSCDSLISPWKKKTAADEMLHVSVTVKCV